MTVSQMHTSFRFGMDKMDGLNYPGFEVEEIDLLLNQAQERIIKQRYGISNIKRTSFEETQKRTEDLKELIRQEVIIPTANSGIINSNSNITTNSVFCTLPADHWFMVWERAIITSLNCNNTTVTIQLPDTTVESCPDCVDCNIENCPGETVITIIPGGTTTVTGRYAEIRPVKHLEFSKVISDAFKAPDNNKVLRIMYEDRSELIPASNCTVVRYLMRYIKKPLTIDLTNNVDCELSEHIHQEIVDEAIKIALEGIEAKRNQSFTPLIDNTKE